MCLPHIWLVVHPSHQVVPPLGWQSFLGPSDTPSPKVVLVRLFKRALDRLTVPRISTVFSRLPVLGPLTICPLVGNQMQDVANLDLR